MIDWFFLNENLTLSTTEDPLTLLVTYKDGTNIYTGTIKRQPTELETLRSRVSELEAQLNPPSADAIDAV